MKVATIRPFLLLSLVLMLAIVPVFGCASQPTAAPTQPPTAPTQPAVAATQPPTAPTQAAAGAIKPGTKINVFVDGGINVAPFEMFKEEIKQKSGIELVLTPVAQADVYTKLKNEFVSGTGAFDLVVYFPALLPEFVNLGNLKPMDEYVSILDPKLDDIIKPYRDLYCTYNGKLYALPYDGDLHVYYYRKDLIADPTEQKNFKAKYGYELKAPETWKEARDFAEFFTRKKGETLAGKTLDKDFYGNGMLLGRGWCHFEWMDHFTAYGGIYFDKDLNPMINSEAGLKALADLKELMKFAPPGILSWGYMENRGSFLGGNLASMILWTDLFKFSYNKDESVVAGKVGLSHIPGAMVDGKLQYKATMPFGRVMSITATSKHPAEAFWVASYMSAQKSIDFTFDPRTGEDPFRYSHVNAPDKLSEYLGKFANTTVPVDDCKNYLDAIKANLEKGYPDLSVPGSSQYMDILDLYISKALAGEMSDKDALDKVAEEWKKINQSLGADTQKAIWQAQLKVWQSLGYVN
ncbi:MAG: extracellular solute-binding protein [Chloroflexota bacterium]